MELALDHPKVQGHAQSGPLLPTPPRDITHTPNCSQLRHHHARGTTQIAIGVSQVVTKNHRVKEGLGMFL